MIVHGSVTVPGDKSITHRALFLGGLSGDRSILRGALTSLDARSTARVLRALGVRVSRLQVGHEVHIVAPRHLVPPRSLLKCGNSGTTARIGLGVLAAQPFEAVLVGDRSLGRRPMARVTQPLGEMGARFTFLREEGYLPLKVRGRGGRLRSISYELPVSSAQIKGALLFAGLAGDVPVRLREPAGRSRDHTERLLRAFGYTVREMSSGWLEFEPDGRLGPISLEIPGDLSSAAFLLGAATLAEGGELRVRGVGVNPTRTGFLTVLRRMGASIDESGRREVQGEPVANLIARPPSPGAVLHATIVEAREIPGLIDEIPMLAVLASRAEGTTTFYEVGELRVKESDRLQLVARNLRAVGVEAEALDNSLRVRGTERPPRGSIETQGDHRIAMAFAVLGQVPGADVRVDDLECAEISFPGFAAALRAIGGGVRTAA